MSAPELLPLWVAARAPKAAPKATPKAKTGPRDYRAEADAWMRERPEGYALFVRFALEASRAGRPFGAKLLAERVRWEHFIGSRRGHEYKLNNNHVAYIARRLVKDHPQLGAFLRFRAAKH